MGQNNLFDSLVNVLDNSPWGNTFYDNILIRVSWSEMSQLRLEQAWLPAYSVLLWSVEKMKSAVVLMEQSEDAKLNMYLYA